MHKTLGPYTMINKIQARKRYQTEEVYIVGSNVNHYHFLGGWHLAHSLRQDEDFDTQLRNFLFYLEPELGRYARFFVIPKPKNTSR